MAGLGIAKKGVGIGLEEAREVEVGLKEAREVEVGMVGIGVVGIVVVEIGVVEMRVEIGAVRDMFGGTEFVVNISMAEGILVCGCSVGCTRSGEGREEG